MTLEWSIAGALLLLALAPVAMRWRSPPNTAPRFALTPPLNVRGMGTRE